MLVCMFDKSEIDLMRSQQYTAIAGSKNDGTVASDDQIWQEKASTISVLPYCVESCRIQIYSKMHYTIGPASLEVRLRVKITRLLGRLVCKLSLYGRLQCHPRNSYRQAFSLQIIETALHSFPRIYQQQRSRCLPDQFCGSAGGGLMMRVAL